MELVWGLLHILIFVYWLGGDLGAFYASRLVVDPDRAPVGRVAAATILLNVDMAPRMALIFAFPTGLALAVHRGWLDLDWLWVAAGFAAAAIWAGLAWMIHLKAGPHILAGRLDQAIRYAVLFSLIGAGVAALTGIWALPVFIAGKCLLLALAIAAGLMIRRALAPFGPAFAQMASGRGGEEADRVVAASLSNAKRYVFVIWAAIIAAAALGVATPSGF
jgi:hypothetical protein